MAEEKNTSKKVEKADKSTTRKRSQRKILLNPLHLSSKA